MDNNGKRNTKMYQIETKIGGGGIVKEGQGH